MIKKILVIGQAPPNQPQCIPYSTTMLYMWFDLCGVSIRASQDMFDFDAVYNNFPGYDKKGGHLKPTREQMNSYWESTLQAKVELADKVILLGKVASTYILSKPKTWGCTTEFLELPHPSYRNANLFWKHKDEIISKLKSFLHGC